MKQSTQDLIAALHSPSEDEFAQIAGDLRLSNTQTSELTRAVTGALADLDESATHLS